MNVKFEPVKFYEHCKDCKYPVVFALCNPPFVNFEGPDFNAKAKEFDYWYYCSNKSCKNHEGEGGFSCDEVPDFIAD